MPIVYMGHYQKMEQSLSLMVFSQAQCPRFAFSMYNIIIRGALLEPHAISRFRVCYLKKKKMQEVLFYRFLPRPRVRVSSFICFHCKRSLTEITFSVTIYCI